MSDRTWLGDGRAGWADVNLSDHATLECAIKCQDFGQSLKVFGPREKLAEFYAEWERLYRAGDERVWEHPAASVFVIVNDAAPDAKKEGYWEPPGTAPEVTRRA